MPILNLKFRGLISSFKKPSASSHAPTPEEISRNSKLPEEIWVAICMDDCLTYADAVALSSTCKHIRPACIPFLVRFFILHLPSPNGCDPQVKGRVEFFASPAVAPLVKGVALRSDAYYLPKPEKSFSKIGAPLVQAFFFHINSFSNLQECHLFSLRLDKEQLFKLGMFAAKSLKLLDCICKGEWDNTDKVTLNFQAVFVDHTMYPLLVESSVLRAIQLNPSRITCLQIGHCLRNQIDAIFHCEFPFLTTIAFGSLSSHPRLDNMLRCTPALTQLMLSRSQNFHDVPGSQCLAPHLSHLYAPELHPSCAGPDIIHFGLTDNQYSLHDIIQMQSQFQDFFGRITSFSTQTLTYSTIDSWDHVLSWLSHICQNMPRLEALSLRFNQFTLGPQRHPYGFGMLEQLCALDYPLSIEYIRIDIPFTPPDMRPDDPMHTTDVEDFQASQILPALHPLSRYPLLRYVEMSFAGHCLILDPFSGNVLHEKISYEQWISAPFDVSRI